MKKKEKMRIGGELNAEKQLRNERLAKPVKIFAYVVGVIAMFIMGAGMSISLAENTGVFRLVLGSVVGIIGIGLMVANSFIYKAIVAKKIYHQDILDEAEANRGGSEEGVIEVKNLTKNYGHGRGVFDVSFSVKKGEVFGFLGPNGAGKSTTMRHLMGFSKPQNGDCFINGMDCWANHAEIMKSVGYLPGEVALPEGVSGKSFLDIMKKLRSSPDDRCQELLKTFEVTTAGSVKRMSIGEKRKLAVAAAFMGNPDVLLLDEPTSGLDPVMQEVFIEFIRGEKAKGKTILLSSHIFSEVEALCDRIAIIKDGKIVSVVSADEVKHYKRKTFVITFADEKNYKKFVGEPFEFREIFPDEFKVEIAADDSKCDGLVKALTKYNVLNFVEHQQTLEEYFMNFYKSDKKFGGIK